MRSIPFQAPFAVAWPTILVEFTSEDSNYVYNALMGAVVLRLMDKILHDLISLNYGICGAMLHLGHADFCPSTASLDFTLNPKP